MVEVVSFLILFELLILNFDFLVCDGSLVMIDVFVIGDLMDFSFIEWMGGDFIEVSEFVIDV